VKISNFARAILLVGFSGSVLAQTADPRSTEKVIITGSSIKRIESEGSLPVQIFRREDLQKQGIVTAEQFIMSLDSNANGLDNLASNSDVVAGAARGNNGLSCANLRGQGCNATLILLNGRRIAAYGLNGGTVDLNSIPMAAIDRIEVLKDGASSLYGTDAIGGVINFITRKDYTGILVQAFGDKTEQVNIKRLTFAETQAIGGSALVDDDEGGLKVDRQKVIQRNALLISLAVVNDDGSRGMDEDQVKNLSSSVANQLLKAVNDFNGFTKKPVESAAKNSSPTPATAIS